MAEIAAISAGFKAVKAGKEIYDVLSKMKSNRQYAKVVGLYCCELSKHVDSIVIPVINSEHAKRYPEVKETIEASYEDYVNALDRGKQDTEQWVHKSLAYQIFNSGTIETTFRRIQTDVDMTYKKFVTAIDAVQLDLQVRNLALNEDIVALLGAKRGDRAALQQDEETNSLIIEALVTGRGPVVPERTSSPMSQTPENFQTELLSYSAKLPQSDYDTSEFDFENMKFIEDGSNAKIYKTSLGPLSVAFKRLTMTSNSGVEVVHRRLECESSMWKKAAEAQHQNIVRFIGLCRPSGSISCIVSEWAENGSITSYLKTAPDANILQLMTDVAQGLKHLHAYTDSGNSNPIIHHNIKASSILIDGYGKARIADFAFASHDSRGIDGEAKDPYLTRLPNENWKAPEIIRGDEPYTTSVDVYCWAILFVVVLDGGYPFGDQTLRSHQSDLLAISSGVVKYKFPKHPFPQYGLDNEHSPLWKLLLRCWSHDIEARPTIAEVLDEILLTNTSTQSIIVQN